MTTLAEKQLANAYTFIDGLNAYDFSAVAAIFSPDLVHEYRPEHLGVPAGKRTRNKEELMQLLENAWTNAFESIRILPPLDVIQGTDAVVFHLKSDGLNKDGRKYNNEYMFTFRFSGEKIISVKEFVDSQYANNFFGGGAGH